MAVVCACGERNTVNHALICRKGEFVIRRHNKIRDIEAEFLDEVCISVKKEPNLLPLSGEIYWIVRLQFLFCCESRYCNNAIVCIIILLVL